MCLIFFKLRLIIEQLEWIYKTKMFSPKITDTYYTRIPTFELHWLHWCRAFKKGKTYYVLKHQMTYTRYLWLKNTCIWNHFFKYKCPGGTRQPLNIIYKQQTDWGSQCQTLKIRTLARPDNEKRNIALPFILKIIIKIVILGSCCFQRQVYLKVWFTWDNNQLPCLRCIWIYLWYGQDGKWALHWQEKYTCSIADLFFQS